MACALLEDFQPLTGLEVAFAAKPLFHRGLQPVERNAVSGLENAIGGRKSVVENRIIGEIPHGKVVNLVDRAAMAFAGGIDALDGEAARKHGFTLNEEPRAARLAQSSPQNGLRALLAHHTVDAAGRCNERTNLRYSLLSYYWF